MLTALLATPPLVRLSAADAVSRFAAAEFVRYHAAAGLGPYAAVALAPELAETLAPLAEGEIYRFLKEPLRIVGATPRGLLHGVYRYLEHCGWRWYFPGPLGEVYQPGRPAPDGAVAGGVARRMLVDRTDAKADPLWRAELPRVVDWLGKQGFTHFALESREVDLEVPEWLVAELGRRGVGLEAGGDLTAELLAATRAAERQPVRHRLGQRRPRRLEVADAEALARLPAVAADRLAGLAPAEALRLVEPGDPPLEAPLGEREGRHGERFSAIAKALAEGLPEGRLVVWQATSAARREFVPPARARLALGLERRSLSHPLDDLGDLRHGRLLADLRAAREHPGGLEVNLPYADLLALRNLTAPLTKVVQADIHALVAEGVDCLSLSIFGAGSFWAYPLNLYVAARCLHEPDLVLPALIQDWCEGLYGRAAEAAQEYLTTFENRMRELWRLRDAQRDPGLRAWRAGEPAGQEIVEAVAASQRELPHVGRLLQAARDLADEPLARIRLDREAERFELNRLHVELWQLRLQAHYGHPTLALHAAARELISQIKARVARLSPATAGAALHHEYAATVDHLADWCGHGTDGEE